MYSDFSTTNSLSGNHLRAQQTENQYPKFAVAVM